MTDNEAHFTVGYLAGGIQSALTALTAGRTDEAARQLRETLSECAHRERGSNRYFRDLAKHLGLTVLS